MNKNVSKLIYDLLKLKSEHDKQGKQLKRPSIQKILKTNNEDSQALSFLASNLDEIKQGLAIGSDLKNHKLEALIKDEKAKNKNLLLQIDDLMLQNEFLLSIQEGQDTFKITKNNELKSEAVAISMLSDVHMEERVEKAVVYDLNEYNLSIASKRINNYFTGLLKQVNKERQNIPIDKLVLCLGGDFITGYIHEELRENNYLSPTEATLEIKGMLVAGLKYLSENGNFKEIVIPCCKGNHGRNTEKKTYATAYKNSYEWMMYNDINNTFRLIGGYDNLNFNIPKSELTYVEAFDKTLRFGHGDHFKFAGGVGGVAIPLAKWLHRVNQQRHADMTILGHWHQFLRPTSDCLMNGSLIGFNAYAAGLGFKPEVPMQQFILLDKKRGFTVNTPILCQ